MIPAHTQDSAPIADHVNQRVCLHAIPWEDYERLLAARGDQCGVRVTYLKGELEFMTPSIDHELLKKRLARLLEAYAETVGIELEGFGSWTVKSKLEERGAEADECYIVGPITEVPQRPDIAIEVVWTSGGIEARGLSQLGRTRSLDLAGGVATFFPAPGRSVPARHSQPAAR